MKISPAALIGPYRLVENLGVVPRGKAYRAIDARSELEVVLKVIPTSVIARVEEPEPGVSWQSMISEMRQLTRIDRNGIVSVYEVIEDEDGITLAFAPADGLTLRAHLAGGTRIDRTTLIAWIGRLLDLLAEAHAQEILHRHLGEDSVRIDRHGQLHLADFGLTQLEFDRVLQPPPELQEGGFHSPASDVYQLAALLHRLAAGHLRDTVGAVALAPTDPLLSLFEKAMREAPEDRYLDAGEMQIALREVTEDTTAHPAPQTLPARGPVPAEEALAALRAAPQLRRPPPRDGREFETRLTDISSLTLSPPPPTAAHRHKSAAGRPPTARPRRRLIYVVALILAALACGAAVARWLIRHPPSIDDTPISIAPQERSPSAESPPDAASSQPASRTGAAQRAATAVDALPGPNPAFVDRQLIAARDLILADDDEAAGTLLEELLLSPDLADPLPVLDALASFYLRTDRPRKAGKILERALEIEPNTERHYQLGLSQAAQGDIPGALTTLRQALASDPTSENVITVIDYLESGQYRHP